MGAATLVLLRIDSAGALVPPAPGRAEPDSTVGFIMVNDHPTKSFKVEIDFDTITTKQDKTTPRNPFKQGGPKFHKLSPGEIDLVDTRTRLAGDFGAATLPFTTYKYSVEVTEVTTTGPPVPPVLYDPDFDIPPP